MQPYSSKEWDTFSNVSLTSDMYLYTSAIDSTEAKMTDGLIIYPTNQKLNLAYILLFTETILTGLSSETPYFNF